jgi:hypothetical protein
MQRLSIPHLDHSVLTLNLALEIQDRSNRQEPGLSELDTAS